MRPQETRPGEVAIEFEDVGNPRGDVLACCRPLKFAFDSLASAIFLFAIPLLRSAEFPDIVPQIAL